MDTSNGDAADGTVAAAPFAHEDPDAKHGTSHYNWQRLEVWHRFLADLDNTEAERAVAPHIATHRRQRRADARACNGRGWYYVTLGCSS